MTNENLMEIFYRALNSITKPTMDNAIRGTFMELTFTEATDILERLTKTSRSWYTRDSVVASPNISSSMIAKQYRKEKE